MASQPEWLKITQGNQLRRVIRPADYLPARGDDVTMFVLRLEQNTTAMRKSLEEIEGKDIRDAIPETDDPHDIKIVGGKPPHHRGQVTGEVMGKNLLECLPHLTEQELDHIIIALAASRADYRALPREQLNRERWRWLALLPREEVRDA